MKSSIRDELRRASMIWATLALVGASCFLALVDSSLYSQEFSTFQTASEAYLDLCSRDESVVQALATLPKSANAIPGLVGWI